VKPLPDSKEKQNLPWKEPAVQPHLEGQGDVVSAHKLNPQVTNRGNKDRRPLEMVQLILTKSGGSFTSQFHASGKEYYLLFHNIADFRKAPSA